MDRRDPWSFLERAQDFWVTKGFKTIWWLNELDDWEYHHLKDMLTYMYMYIYIYTYILMCLKVNMLSSHPTSTIYHHIILSFYLDCWVAGGCGNPTTFPWDLDEVISSFAPIILRLGCPAFHIYRTGFGSELWYQWPADFWSYLVGKPTFNGLAQNYGTNDPQISDHGHSRIAPSSYWGLIILNHSHFSI